MIPARAAQCRITHGEARLATHPQARMVRIHPTSMDSRGSAQRVAHLPKRWASDVKVSNTHLVGHAPSIPPLPGDPGYHLVEFNMREQKRWLESQETERSHTTVPLDNQAIKQIVAIELSQTIPREFKQMRDDILDIKRILADLNARLASQK